MEYRRKKTGRKTGRCKGAASARARLRSTSTGNFNASHSSLAAVEADLYGADVVERRRAKRGELLWDNSREMAKEFPKPEQVAIRSVSAVFVRSNNKAAANGGKVYGITQRPLDTAHIIKRRQQNGLRPVKYVDEELLERRKIARARMEQIAREVVDPIVGAHRHFLRLIRTSRLRVAKHPDVYDSIVAITASVKLLRAQREKPLDLSSNGNVVRHLRKLLKTAGQVDGELNETIGKVEKIRAEQLQLYQARVADEFELRRTLFEDHFAPPYDRFKNELQHVDQQPLLGRIPAVRDILASHQNPIVRVAEAFAVPLNAFSDTLMLESYRGLVHRVKKGIKMCNAASEVMERELAALRDRLSRVEEQRAMIEAKYPAMLENFNRCKALIDGSLDGLGSIPVIINGLAETKAAMSLLADIVANLSDDSVALSELSVCEALDHRQKVVEKSVRTVRTITATADKLNLGPTRKRLKRLTAYVKAAPDLDHRGPGPVALMLKAARIAVNKCTDGLIWNLSPEDLENSDFLDEFGALIARADEAVRRVDAAIALHRRTRNRAAVIIQSQVRLGRNPDFDSDSEPVTPRSAVEASGDVDEGHVTTQNARIGGKVSRTDNADSHGAFDTDGEISNEKNIEPERGLDVGCPEHESVSTAGPNALPSAITQVNENGARNVQDNSKDGSEPTSDVEGTSVGSPRDDDDAHASSEDPEPRKPVDIPNKLNEPHLASDAKAGKTTDDDKVAACKTDHETSTHREIVRE